MSNALMSNLEVSWLFQEMADLLEIKGENFFKIRAYRNAAKTISKLDKSLAELVKNNALEKIPGIGKAISSKIKEILKTGSCEAYKKLLEEIPKGVLEMRLIPGIGAKRARILFEELNISSLEQLEEAARKNLIRKLPGMSAKFESDILRHIKMLKGENKLISIGTARKLGKKLVEYLSTIPGVSSVELGGSL
ncbi:helix-hairpin-helix domain-containing protein, partial [Peptococcaceae bacterium]|nr:helix-hairpin-helix domain-containing protein [Peptococcaceae bacterium]